MPELEIGRVVLSCFVHPGHDSRDLTTNLIVRALQRARELGAESAQVNVHEKNAATRKFFSGMGFDRIRRFLEMSLDMMALSLPDMTEILSVCRRLEPGEESKLTFIQNRSFIDTWGFNPSTEEEIAYRMGLANCSPNVLFLCEDGNPLGYCWTRIESTIQPGKRLGQIHMLGVEPHHRGKGIGKQVLLAGLSHLKREGIRFVKLTVDEKNEAACKLYKSLGFTVGGQTLWYEKVLN
jgi:mycothiol synthase